MDSPLLDGLSPPSSLGNGLSPKQTLPSIIADPLLTYLETIEDNLATNELFEPLYPGANITVCGAYCCVMHFASTNKLTLFLS